MALDIVTQDLIIDETLTNQDDDSDISNATVTYLLGLDGAGGLSTPEVAYQTNFVVASATAGETISSISLAQSLSGAAFSTTTGINSNLQTVDGNYIWLFQKDAAHPNVVIGVIGTSDPFAEPDEGGSLAFSFALVSTSATTADLYTVQYVPLLHPDATNPDDRIDLTNHVYATISGVTTVSFTGDNAAPGNHDYYLLNSPSDATKQLLVVGFVGTTNATANVSTQGFGVGNQSINAAFTQGQGATPAETLQVDFVTGGDRNAGTYSQIQYDDHLETITSAGFTINQITPSTPTKRVDIAIGAYNVTGNEQGNEFANGSPTTPVDITSIRLTGQSGYAFVITADGTYPTASGNITVSGLTGTGNLVTITGLDNVTVVDITTATPLDRLTVSSVDANEGLDITEFHFTSETPNARTEEVGSYINFDDDGPAITRNLAERPLLTTDDSQTPGDSDGPTSFATLFDTNFGTDGFKDSDNNDLEDADAVTFALSLKNGQGTNSGLTDTLSGDAILLRVNLDGDVEGYVAAGDLLVFKIDLNPDTGAISLIQSRAIVHNDSGDAVESGASAAVMAADLIVLTATIRDGDGDSDTDPANIGDAFRFEDDGPTITRNAVVRPLLTTDDSLTPSASNGPTSFATLFDPSFGKDEFKDSDDNNLEDADAVTFALSLKDGQGTNSGLTDTLSGDAILLRVNADGDVEGYVADGDLLVFKIDLAPLTGDITLLQYRSIVHDNPVDAIELGASAAVMAADLIVLTATIRDGDGDTDSDPANIGDAFRFEDDGPTAAIALSGESAITDESVSPPATDGGFAEPNDNTGNVPTLVPLAAALIGYDQANLLDTTGGDPGADGDGGTAFTLALSADGVYSGLDTTDGTPINLYLSANSDMVIGRAGEATDEPIFAIFINGVTGAVVVEQYESLLHSPVGTADDVARIDDEVLFAVATLTDGDGDEDGAQVDIGARIGFEDDGPTVSLALTGDEVRIDESVGADAGDPNADDETDQADLTVIGYAQVAGAVLFDPSGSDVGEDEEGASTLYTLAIAAQPDPDTLEVSASNADITLVQVDDQTIEGQYDDGVDPNAVAFRVHIDADDGDVTFTQYAALEHGNTLLSDDPLNLAGLISAVLTTTDGDGDVDSDSVDLGAVLIVEDDGPVVTGVNVEATVDDDGGSGGNPGGDGDDPLAPKVVNGSVVPIFDAGSDGLASFTLSIANFTPQDPAPVLTSQGGLVEYDQTANLLTGYVESGTTAGYQLAEDREVFTFALNGATGAFIFTQIDQVDHPVAGTEDNLDIQLGILLQAVDNDGDSSDAAAPIELTIHANDDSPEVNTADTEANNATGSNDTITTDGATGNFAFAVGFDDRVGSTYSETNSDLRVTLTSGLVFTTAAGSAITEMTTAWTSEDASQATFTFTFEYQPDPSSSATTPNSGMIVFDKSGPGAGTYTFTLNDPISSYGIISTATADGFVGYLPDTTTVDTSQPFVTVAALAGDFFVQFTGRYEAAGGTDGNNTLAKNNNLDALNPGEAWNANHDDDTFSEFELFTQTSNWVSVSGTAAGVAGDTMQAGEVLDFNFYESNPFGDLTPSAAPATTSTMFIEFDALDNGEDLVVVLKLVNADNPAITATRAVVVQYADIFHIAEAGQIPASFLQVGSIDQNDGMVIIESNDYNINPGDNWTITGAQVVASTEGLSSDITASVINLNRATGDGGGSSYYGVGVDPFSAVKDSGNNNGGTWDGDVFKIVNIGFLTEITPDSQFNFDVEVIDFDGDASAVQSLTIDVLGGDALAGLVAPLSASTANEVAYLDTMRNVSDFDMAFALSQTTHLA